MRCSCVLIISALLVTAGCGRRAVQVGGAPPPPLATVMPPPLQLYADNGGGIRDSVRHVVRSATELADFWRRATSVQSSPPEMPTIDFNRDMVLVVAAGRMTPEGQIQVDSLLVRRELTPSGNREETLTIIVRTNEGCRPFRTNAFPLQIVRARKFDGPIKWEERAVKATCLGPPDNRN